MKSEYKTAQNKYGKRKWWRISQNDENKRKYTLKERIQLTEDKLLSFLQKQLLFWVKS